VGERERDTGNYSSSLLLPCVKYSSAIVIEESLTSRYIDNSIKESTYSVYRFIEIPAYEMYTVTKFT
jgi:hypothetical protein